VYLLHSSGHGSNQILKIDTINGTVTFLDVILTLPGSGFWDLGALAIDGCIYFMPSNATHLLKLNPDNDSVASIGDQLGDEYCKYSGTVLGKDNCLYGIPKTSKRIMRFNPVDQSISFVGDEARDMFCCVGNGALGRDGCIYALSHGGYRVIKMMWQTTPTTQLYWKACRHNSLGWFRRYWEVMVVSIGHRVNPIEH
jgi:hypothetical protein